LSGNISEITTPVREIDVTILVSVVSWCNFHHKNITRLTSLEQKYRFCLQMVNC